MPSVRERWSEWNEDRGLQPSPDFRPRVPADIWARAKEIDGFPQLEWSYVIFTNRVVALSPLVRLLFYQPLGTYERVRDIVLLRSRLQRGGVSSELLPIVTVGFEFFASGFYAIGGRLEVAQSNDRSHGRHSVEITQVIEGGTTLVFPNSWGEAWGDHGFGYMSRGYFEAHAEDAWVGWSSLRGPSPRMLRELGGIAAGDPRSVSDDQLAAAWSVRNEIGYRTVRVRGSRCKLVNWRVASLNCPSPRFVNVAEVQTLRRVIGRVHVEHVADERGKYATVLELFVKPEFRRQGYGSFLEEEAVSLVRSAGGERICIPLLEGDAVGANRAQALAFIGSHGYVFKEGGGRLPRTAGVAVKELGG
jgi:GNAT superfamily N-acetyltransferase